MQITLSTLAVVLGLGYALPQIYGVLKPAAFGASVRKFPRSLPWGYALMLTATAWFLYYFNQESVSDFAAYKNMLMAFFGAIGVASCFFVKDYLAVRGLAVVLMLIGKVICDTARWADTEWRLLIISWAYVMVIAGIWFTIYPWHLRDLLNWGTANEKRIRLGSAIRLAFGLLVAVLGLTVFRAA
ncbi:hypothetical protein [Pedosphaera parvula]|uniref:Uncharacterized protein n=1 Tax=Pedosphaera parvula (strain Ellin514) TaxID=320771 RepID=B9XII9_PEDPL|nr:hypothetical protein [Pedosphaera parvula]EEF60450.1 hypothetical protein Cflav_PD3420 [Pedosphaera parvula Ellin514]